MNLVQLLRNQWDRAGACLATIGGAVVLFLGYLGISGTSYTQEQLPYLVSGGAFGLFLLGVAGILWLTADLRDEWRKLDDLDEHLQMLIALEVSKREPRASAPAEEQPIEVAVTSRTRGTVKARRPRTSDAT
ncbi:MAG: hypothetical protein QOG99_699 [Frankiales bacterium]|jgi:hypothetical protein|nr:hypothetical protein [Frankiales bacterium]